MRLRDGRRVYVEPQSFSMARGRLLLVGHPAYVWRREGINYLPEAADSVLGVVLRPNAEAEIVPSPIAPATAMDIRAAERRDGTWRVILAEAAPSQAGETERRVQEYWSGITDGRRWRDLVKLPTAPGRLRTAYASAVVETANLSAIALPVESTDSITHRVETDVAVFERVAGRWSVHVVRTKRVAYVAIAAPPRGGLMLAVVRNDTTLAADQNSLFMFEQERGETTWRDLGRMIRGGAQPIQHPEMAFVGDDLAVTYRVMSDSGESSRFALPTVRASAVQTISQAIEDIKQVTVDGWLLGSVTLLPPPSNNPSGTLVVHRYRDMALVTDDSVVSPFQSLVGVATTLDTLYATGPVQARTAQDPIVSSYLFAAAWRCERGK